MMRLHGRILRGYRCRNTIKEVERWKCAYKSIIPQDYLDSIPEGRWSSSVDNPDWKTLLCIEDGKIIGTCSFCKSRFEQFHNWGEIISIYLLPNYIGKGYGKALMKSALSALKMQGYEKILLWVLEENIRARHFYEQSCFSPTDDFINDTIGGKELREIRYIFAS